MLDQLTTINFLNFPSFGNIGGKQSIKLTIPLT
mgnify:CR=1 FL=1